MFKKVMYKVKRKDNKELYRIRDFTSGDKVDKSKFEEVINNKGEKQLQAKVHVLYQDEYASLNQDIAPLKEELDQLQSIINDKDSQIKALKKQINEKEHIDNDEVKQLKEDNFNIKHEFEQLKKTHANQILEIYNKHNKETNKLKEQYDTKLDELNDKLLSEVQANNQASDKLKDKITLLHQEKSKIEKDYIEDLKTLESEHANEKIELTKAHQDEVTNLKEDISQIKQDHLKEINDNDKSHNDRHEKMRSYFLKVVTLDNKEDVSEIVEIEKSIPSLLKPFMRKHIKQVEDMKERKILKEPEKIIKTYELSGKKEKEWKFNIVHS